MSLQIKCLTNGAPTKDLTLPAVDDSLNIIPTANDVYNLYTAAADKTAIAKGLRMINTHTSEVKVSVYFKRPTETGQHQRRYLAPPNMAIPAGSAYIDEAEITLEPGDSIQAKADTANVIHYFISGVERDVI